MTDEELENEYNFPKDSLQNVLDNLNEWRQWNGTYPKIEADLDAAVKHLEKAVENINN
jgi:hypothetical protein